MLIIILLSFILIIGLAILITVLRPKEQNTWHQIDKELHLFGAKLNDIAGQREQWQQLLQQQQHASQQQREQFDAYQIKSLTSQQEFLNTAMQDVRTQITTTLGKHTSELNQRLDRLTKDTQQRLKEISKEVDQQLSHGFSKTSETFTNIVKRLTIIDQAQQKITELSSNVVSLQNILSDKRSRGAFGEVQLNQLISNMLPSSHYAFQHTLSNGKRADCMLFLPEPSGHIAIDAKFPLESYQTMTNTNISSSEQQKAEQQFRQDIKKHIQDIANKYIIPNETANGALMFIPAEAIFAEIHAHHPACVAAAQRQHVWLVSPTTMMAVLTTAAAVLKDEATRNQVHIIREHLLNLSKDFERFQKRMDNLSRHIDQAQQDVSLVHKSSAKISSRFRKIENVELDSELELETDPTEIA